jgi:hypothetical protein
MCSAWNLEMLAITDEWKTITWFEIISVRIKTVPYVCMSMDEIAFTCTKLLPLFLTFGIFFSWDLLLVEEWGCYQLTCKYFVLYKISFVLQLIWLMLPFHLMSSIQKVLMPFACKHFFKYLPAHMHLTKKNFLWTLFIVWIKMYVAL